MSDECEWCDLTYEEVCEIAARINLEWRGVPLPAKRWDPFPVPQRPDPPNPWKFCLECGEMYPPNTHCLRCSRGRFYSDE